MSTAAVFLKIERDIDTTWHPGFLYKLHKLNILTNLIEFISSFYRGENSQFLWKGKYRRLKKYNHGRLKVPSCPQIFNSIYIYLYIISPNTSCIYMALFADDTCMYTTDRRILRKLHRGLN
jgi:hypothetical protein